MFGCATGLGQISVFYDTALRRKMFEMFQNCAVHSVRVIRNRAN